MQHQTDVITIFSICKFCVILFHQRPQGCAQDMTFPCSLLSFVFVASKNKILISIYPGKQKRFLLAVPKRSFIVTLPQ